MQLPNGWTFIIPNQDSVSYGYLFNNTITKKQDAINDFTSRFDLDYVTDTLEFSNYVKNFRIGERTILQGNMYGFIEPMEATAVGMYHKHVNVLGMEYLLMIHLIIVIKI